MKNTIFLLVLIFLTISFCKAQEIEIQKVFGAYKFIQNGNTMKMNDLVNAVKHDQQALDLMLKAQSNHTIASVLSGVGGFLIGWPLGTAIGSGGQEPNWGLAAAGAGLVLVAIPFSSNSNKTAKEAVQLYNSTLNSSSSHKFKPQLKLIANQKGIGLAMNF